MSLEKILKMISISVSDKIKNICPHFVGIVIDATVTNTEYSKNLWDEIDNYTKDYRNSHTIENIKSNAAIAATRQAYKRLGKDPNRYRPSAESLCRRILRELPLYKVNTLVDIINLISIRSGYSIGGFDSDLIEGNTLALGVGEADEPYEGIGRGILNIEGLPVYRDIIGGIGTPTSDHERTKISMETKHLLMIINAYNGEDDLIETVEYAKMLLEKYADAQNILINQF